MSGKAKIGLKLNVSYRHLDKDGNVKPIWQENALHTKLIKLFGAGVPKIPGLLGHWATEKQYANLVTNAGKAAVAGLIIATGFTDAFDYIEVGTGTTAAALTDTTLETAITDSGLQRALATLSRVTTDVTNDTAQLTITFSVTGTKAVTESGVFSASSAGTMLARQVFSAINVVNTDSLQITWKIDVD